jgi:hypothetical protein
MASISDDFSASMGTNWTAVHGVGLSASGGVAVNSGDGQYDGSQHNTSMSTGNHSVSAVIAGKAAANYFDCKIRHDGNSGASRNGWQCSVGGSNEWFITEVVNGSGTDRASGTTTFADGDTLTAEGDGTTIRLRINGSEVGTYTSTLYQSNVRVGLGIYRGPTVASLDNFAAADLGGGVSAAWLKA